MEGNGSAHSESLPHTQTQYTVTCTYVHMYTCRHTHAHMCAHTCHHAQMSQAVARPACALPVVSSSSPAFARVLLSALPSPPPSHNTNTQRVVDGAMQYTHTITCTNGQLIKQQTAAQHSTKQHATQVRNQSSSACLSPEDTLQLKQLSFCCLQVLLQMS